MPRVAAASAPLFALLAGCGDSLLGQQGLAELQAFTAPERPAWELRWYRGDGLGFTAACALEAIDPEEVLVDALPFGFVDAPEPRVETPPVFVEGGAWRYAIALSVMVERPSEAATERLSTEADPLNGVWGAATEQVLLFAEGDLGAVADALSLGGDEYLVEGAQFADVYLPESEFSGSFDGALWLVEPVDYELLLPVEARSSWWVPWPEILSGEARGGTTFEPCGE